MLTLITVPTDLLAQIGATATPIFTDLAPIVELVVGIALAIFVAGWIIARFRGSKEDRMAYREAQYRDNGFT